jgi:hypothetical protein
MPPTKKKKLRTKIKIQTGKATIACPENKESALN